MAPDGSEWVVEAWRPFELASEMPLIGPVIAMLFPGPWRIAVKRFPVKFGSRAVRKETALTTDAAVRRLDELASALEAGRLPR